MYNIGKRHVCLFKQLMEWHLGGRIRYNGKVDFALPGWMLLDYLVGFVPGSHSGSDGESALLRSVSFRIMRKVGPYFKQDG